MRMVRIGCDVPEQFRTDFDVMATRMGLTISDVLRVAILAFLDDLQVDLGDPAVITYFLSQYHDRVVQLEQSTQGQGEGNR